METQVLNNNEVSVMESSRKRKRESEKCATPQTPMQPVTAGFVNTAFSSTPKKLIVKRRIPTTSTLPNATYPPPGLEVKSIAHIVQQSQCPTKQSEIQQELPKNPYEVVRKPPKKKKRQADKEEACFENPALNLELPEKQFNPYEVIRAPNSVPVTPSLKNKCFVNQALNLRGQDVPAAKNPFEIPRCNSTVPEATAGVENSALEINPLPTELKIRLPFMPTVGCRIDFKNMPLQELTPSKLLAEKLVFSPVPRPKRSIDSTGDENSTMDIGKELDQYQLELENSINEAKLRKSCIATEMEANYKLEIVEQKMTFTQKLQEIVEDDEEQEENEVKTNVEQLHNVAIELKFSDDNNIKDAALPTLEEDETGEITGENDKAATEDVAYASESEEDEASDFKRPSTFVRAFRREVITADRNDSLNSTHSSNTTDDNEFKKPHNMKNLIRKSLRKLMHSSHVSKNEDVVQAEKEPVKHVNIITSIRNSLRRKPTRQPLIPNEEDQSKVVDVSIVDSSERTVKLKSCSDELQYATIEQLTYEKKHSLRNSLRRSKQIMKSFLHKDQEHYAFCK